MNKSLHLSKVLFSLGPQNRTAALFFRGLGALFCCLLQMVQVALADVHSQIYIVKYFCAVYHYEGKADLSGGY